MIVIKLKYYNSVLYLPIPPLLKSACIIVSGWEQEYGQRAHTGADSRKRKAEKEKEYPEADFWLMNIPN